MGYKIIFFTLACFLLAQQEVHGAPSSKINSGLLNTFQSQKTVNVFLNMRDGTGPVLAKVRSLSYATRESQINTVADALKTHASSSQASVLSFLNEESIPYKTFWISNQVFINDASFELVEKLAAIPEVGEVLQEKSIQIDDPMLGKIVEDPNPDNSTRANQWGVLKIEAHRAWPITTGQGIVVGTIDTGVRATHQDLRNNFRSDKGWRDPGANQQIPYDNHGHGTHTMGTIAGANGIGVAPGVQWIACKGCASAYCSDHDLAFCGQWMLCPTNPDGSDEDCSKAPHIVSNSWAMGREVTWYDAITDAWIAAGIIPVFAVGNIGPGCSTDESPGDRNVIGVGSTVDDDSLSYFSSRGPTSDGRIKPEISAPGSNVYSAHLTSDSAYTFMSGTSMACPHAAGTIALIQSIKRLSYEQVKIVLFNSVDRASLIPPNTNCGVPDTTWPNNAFGHGRINARISVTNALNFY